MKTNNSTSVSIYFDKRRNPVGIYTIHWSVYHNNITKVFSTGLKISQESVDFLKEYRNGISNKFKDPRKIHLWNMIYGESYTDSDTGNEEISYLKRGEIVLKLLGHGFTFEKFKSSIHNPNPLYQEIKSQTKAKSETDVYSLLNAQKVYFYENEQVGTGNLYQSTISSLIRFVENLTPAERKEFSIPSSLHVQNITVQFLNKYERWMAQKGKKSKTPTKPDTAASYTTIGIYLRNLRTIMKESLEKLKTITEDQYPFGKGKYQIPEGEGTNRYIEKEEVDEFYDFDLNKSDKYIHYKQRSLDFWLLSYMCYGANMTDLLSLKHQDISAETLKFIRQKTKRTTKTQLREITVILNDYIRAIIARWSDKINKEPNDFVFPFINHEMSAQRKKAVINQFTKVTNLNMNRFAKSLGIEGKVNTYHARHTFANILQENNVPPNAIKSMFGHATLMTTEKYFGRTKKKDQEVYTSILLPKSITPKPNKEEDKEIG